MKLWFTVLISFTFLFFDLGSCQTVLAYRGCSGKSIFTTFPSTNIIANSPEECASKCNTQLNQPIALRKINSSSPIYCWCGVPTLPYQAAPNVNCDLDCPADTSKKCGNSNGQEFWSFYVNASISLTIVIQNNCTVLKLVPQLQQCRAILKEQLEIVNRGVIENQNTNPVSYSVPNGEIGNVCGTAISSGCFASANDQTFVCTYDISSGFRTCTCPYNGTRYEPDTSMNYVPGVECTDINECSRGTDNCDPVGGNCTNEDGSFSCSCNTGFVQVSNSSTNCTPIIPDECLLGIPPVCSYNAICTNLRGPGHTCACKPGFTGNGVICNDINECSPSNPCGSGNTCVNTVGSYICTCGSNRIKLVDGSCASPTKDVSCQNPASKLERRLLWGPTCSVVYLLPCDYSGTSFDVDGRRIVVKSTQNAKCSNNMLVPDFDPTVLNDRTKFMADGGESFIQPEVMCGKSEFSITFNRPVADNQGFNLSRLFLGGIGDFNSARTMYSSRTECQGMPWFAKGLQYRFASGLSTACGTTITDQGGKVTYTNAVRGTYGTKGPVIDNEVIFYVIFSCVYDKTLSVSKGKFFVYNAANTGRKKRSYISRSKREVSVIKSIDVPPTSIQLSMNLWKDAGFKTLYSTSTALKPSDRVFVDVALQNFDQSRFSVHLLRCWQSPSTTGVGDLYRDIVSNGCQQQQWSQYGNILYKTGGANSVRFSFEATSFKQGEHSVYVSCLVDVVDKRLYKDVDEKCGKITGVSNGIQADLYMNVLTVGPFTVNDPCGGKPKAGGCEHYCSVSKDGKSPVCYCESGFEVVSSDPKRCQVLTNSPQTSQLYWYYYVIPILVLVTILCLALFAFYKVKKNRATKGKYKLADEGEAFSSEGGI